MLQLLGPGARLCDGLTRRDFLHAGSLGVLGLTLPDLFTLRTLGAVNPPATT